MDQAGHSVQSSVFMENEDRSRQATWIVDATIGTLVVFFSFSSWIRAYVSSFISLELKPDEIFILVQLLALPSRLAQHVFDKMTLKKSGRCKVMRLPKL
jgi:hypothetical protein